MGAFSHLPKLLRGGIALTESTFGSQGAKYEKFTQFTTSLRNLRATNPMQTALNYQQYFNSSSSVKVYGHDDAFVYNEKGVPIKVTDNPPVKVTGPPPPPADQNIPADYLQETPWPKNAEYVQPPVDTLPHNYDIVQRLQPMMTLELVKAIQKGTQRPEHVVPPGGKTYGHRADAVYQHPKNSPYLPVDYNPWPQIASIGLLNMALGLVHFLNGGYGDTLLVGIFTTSYGLAFWWRDLVREVTFMGWHTLPLQQVYRAAFLMFILSEVMFFFTIFWTWFWNQANQIFRIYPEEFIIKAWGIPILNTFILLTSGGALTWSHHAMIGATEFAKKTPK